MFVGPDNGLLVAAAEAAAEAPVSRVVELAPPAGTARPRAPPSTGAICSHRPPPRSAPAPRSTISASPSTRRRWCACVGGVVEEGRLHDGRACLRTEVTWVDHYGNLQLAATVADARVAGIPLDRLRSSWPPGSSRAASIPTGCRSRWSPRARSCAASTPSASWQQGEFGLLVDANGHLAVVAGQASAAHWLNVAAGELLVLAW